MKALGALQSMQGFHKGPLYVQHPKGLCEISSVKGLSETPRGIQSPLCVQRSQGLGKPPLYRNKMVSWKGIDPFALGFSTLNCMHGPVESLPYSWLLLSCVHGLDLKVFCIEISNYKMYS